MLNQFDLAFEALSVINHMSHPYWNIQHYTNCDTCGDESEK